MPTPILRVPPHLFGRKILIVEDEAIIAMDLENTLSAAGIRVMGPATSVQEALAIIGKDRPDAAILDLNLSGELVTPVARELRRMNVPFLLSTAYNHLRPEDDTALSGVENMGKPLASSRFIEALGNIL